MFFKKIKLKKVLTEITNSQNPEIILKRHIEQNPRLCLTVIEELIKENLPALSEPMLAKHKYFCLLKNGFLNEALEYFSSYSELYLKDPEMISETLKIADNFGPCNIDEKNRQVLCENLLNAFKEHRLYQNIDKLYKVLELFLKMGYISHYQELRDIAHKGTPEIFDDSSGLRFLHGLFYIHSHNNIKAVETLSRISRDISGPNSDYALKSHELLKDLKLQLKKAHADNNISTEDILAYALIHLEQNDFKKAEKILETSLKSISQDRKNSFLYQIADIHKQKNNTEKAIHYLNEVLEQNTFDISTIQAIDDLIEHYTTISVPLQIDAPACKSIERSIKNAIKDHALNREIFFATRLMQAKLYYYQNRDNQALKIYDEIYRDNLKGLSAQGLFLYAKLSIKARDITKATALLSLIENKFQKSIYHNKAVDLMKSLSKDLTKNEKTRELSHEELEAKDFLQDTLESKKLVNRLKEGLLKTHDNFFNRLNAFFKKTKGMMDDDIIEGLEELLILSDIGINTTSRIINILDTSLSREEKSEPKILMNHIKKELTRALTRPETGPIDTDMDKPFIILVVGVNGVGKTTTIAKLAFQYKNKGKKVMLAACDTFRAAAIEQLETWAKRIGIPLIKHKEGADPSAVAYDAINSAKAKDLDILIIDTAGRLHTKVNLMQELEKIKRTANKLLPGSPHSTILVLDATNGQNAISQARQFKQIVDINGIILTKLDGTAKGGIIIAISEELGLPIKYIGVGEKAYDLMPFSPSDFVEALFN